MNTSKHTSTPEAGRRSRRSRSQTTTQPLYSSEATSLPTAPPIQTRSHKQVPTSPEIVSCDYGSAEDYMHTAPVSAPGYPYIPHNATPYGLEACQKKIDSINSRPERKRKSTKRSAEAPIATGSPQLDQESRHSGEGTPPLSRSTPYGDNGSTADEHELKTPISPHMSARNDTAHARESKSKSRSPRREPTVRFEDTPDQTPASRSASHNLPPHSESDDDSSYARRALAQVDHITYDFNKLVIGFHFPSNIDFMSPQDEELFPSLAYTPNNKALLAHKQKLDGVLEKLDAVELHGDEEVRRVRKEAVERVLKALEDLNRKQAMVWFNRQYEQRMAKA